MDQHLEYHFHFAGRPRGLLIYTARDCALEFVYGKTSCVCQLVRTVTIAT